jgi:hypothetical protein
MAKTYIYVFEEGETFTHDRPPTQEDIHCINQGILSVLVVEGTVSGVDQNGEEYALPQCFTETYTHPTTNKTVEYHTFGAK